MATVSEGSLDKKVTDGDVAQLAAFMVTWEKMLGPLGMDRAKQKEIEHVSGYGKQKVECVEEWRETVGEKSTYRAFIEAARRAKLNLLADKVVAMLQEREPTAITVNLGEPERAPPRSTAPTTYDDDISAAALPEPEGNNTHPTTLSNSRLIKADQELTQEVTGNTKTKGLTHATLMEPDCDDETVQAFVADLQASPESGSELAQTLISRLQRGSLVGYIALTEAVKRCGDCKEVVRAFIVNGWPPDQPQQGGKTLVHVLAEEGCTESLMMVLEIWSEQGARAADENRHTPLHLAVRAGRLETVQAMLNREDCRKSIDYQDKKFNTALHLAVESGSAGMVEVLLTVPDISLGVLNEANETAMQIAQRKKDPRIISLLEEEKSPSSPVNLLSPVTDGAAVFERRGSLREKTFVYPSSSEEKENSMGLPSPVTDGALFRRRSKSYDNLCRQSTQSGSRRVTTPRDNQSNCSGMLRRTASMEGFNRQMLKLQRQLINYKGTLMGKKLLKKGELKKCTRKGGLKNCTLFVLSDVVLYTKFSDIVRKYIVSNELSVRGMEVLDSQDSEQPAVRNEPFSFTLTSREKAMHLVASSQEEKIDWIQCLKDCIAALHTTQSSLTQLPTGAGLGARAPPWVPDTHVTACQLSSCGKKFSLFERKHHCRQCGKVVCGTCSPEKRYLNYLQKKERVCNECVEAFAGHKSVDGDSGPQQIRTVISGYAMRLRHGVKGDIMWYRLDENNIIHIYGAHQDTKPSYQIVLKMGYSVHGDMGSGKIVLTHPTGREELNESFQVEVDEYLKWFKALKERIIS